MFATQIGLKESIKQKFWEYMNIFSFSFSFFDNWENMNKLIQELSNGKKTSIGGNLNGPVGKENRGFERVDVGGDMEQGMSQEMIF